MLLTEILDLIAPSCCMGCFRRLHSERAFPFLKSANKTMGINICALCMQEFQFPLWPSSQYENTWTLCAYQGIVRKVVNRIKEHNDERLLQFLLEKTLPSFLSRLMILGADASSIALIPAPTRRTHAMINIPFRICEMLSAHFPRQFSVGYSVPSCAVYPIMRLDTYARDSSGLNTVERKRNLAQHLYFTSSVRTIQESLEDSFIVLIDDVITSGTTMYTVKNALDQCDLALHAVFTICHA